MTTNKLAVIHPKYRVELDAEAAAELTALLVNNEVLKSALPVIIKAFEVLLFEHLGDSDQINPQNSIALNWLQYVNISSVQNEDEISVSELPWFEKFPKHLAMQNLTAVYQLLSDLQSQSPKSLKEESLYDSSTSDLPLSSSSSSSSSAPAESPEEVSTVSFVDDMI
jgi:hypothetical protein